MKSEPTSTLEPLVMTQSQASVLLGVSIDTVRRLVRRGDLPHLRVGTGLRIRHTDVNDYVNGRTTRNWRAGDGRSEPGDENGPADEHV